MMLDLMFHGCTNIGDLLSLVSAAHRSFFCSKMFYPCNYSSNFIIKKSAAVCPLISKLVATIFFPFVTSSTIYTDDEDDDDDGNSSFWQQELTRDIMDGIIGSKRGLSLSDRIRMSAVCKSWRHLLYMDNKRLLVHGSSAAAHHHDDIPWLLLPYGEGPAKDNYLSFYSFSEGRFYNLKLPREARGGRCCGSSRGWLGIIAAGSYYINPKLFLWNPMINLLSSSSSAPPPQGQNVIHQLPSLSTIPHYKQEVDNLPCGYDLSALINRIEVYCCCNKNNATTMVVALLCFEQSTLALCTIGDKKWTIFHGKSNDRAYDDILFMSKCNNNNNMAVLYTLDSIMIVEEEEEEEVIISGGTSTSEVMEAHSVRLRDDYDCQVQVIIKCITKVVKFNGLSRYNLQEGYYGGGEGAAAAAATLLGQCYYFGKNGFCRSCLVESSSPVGGELLIIQQNLDVCVKYLEGDDVDYNNDDQEIDMRYYFNYYSTKGFRIFKVILEDEEEDVNDDNDNVVDDQQQRNNTKGKRQQQRMMIERVTSLGDQVLFLTENGSVSIPTRTSSHSRPEDHQKRVVAAGQEQHKMMKKNCIHFMFMLPFDSVFHVPKVTREGGVLDLEDGTIKRYLPSFKLPLHSYPSWFLPILRS